MSRNNRIKVIAADLDGTLTNSMKHVMPYTIQMMQKAGLSFAMGNGCNEAKNAADFVIGSNDEDGVGKAIQQYILQ